MSILRTKGPRSRSQTITTGPWTRVHNVADALEVAADALYHAENMYFPGGAKTCSTRPPFVQVQAAGTLGQVASRTGQGIYEHVATDGTRYRVVVCGGKVYRWNGASTFTDVTPVGVAISTSARVYMASLGDKLVVTDGVNRPWIGTNLSSTPITGAYIDYNGSGVAWTAYGAPVVYAAKMFFVCNLLNGVGSRNAIMWSEEADPATGYQQTGYDNLWELTQTAADPLYALAATNGALYYFRARSIGLIAGTVDTTFQTTATHDAVSESVGTTTPASVVLAEQALWFLDERGFPYRLPLGGSPQPIWEQMRDTAMQELRAGGKSGLHEVSGFGVYVDDLGVVLLASWPYLLGTAPSEVYAFSANDGRYCGAWSLGTLGVSTCLMHAAGVVRDSSSRVSLCALANTDSANAAATGGAFVRLRTVGEMSASAGTAAWTDFVTSARSVVTHYVGAESGAEWLWNRATLHAMNMNGTEAERALTLTQYTPFGAVAAQTAVLSYPAQSAIGADATAYFNEARAEWGLAARGRWLQCRVACASNTGNAQAWSPHKLVLDAVPLSETPSAT